MRSLAGLRELHRRTTVARPASASDAANRVTGLPIGKPEFAQHAQILTRGARCLFHMSKPY